MAIILVTYDLKQPGRNYQPVHEYLKKHTHCKGLESVWLLDTLVDVGTIRENVRKLADSNDVTFVVQLTKTWSSWGYSCGDWLNKPERRW